jgi:hypothetical protein
MIPTSQSGKTLLRSPLNMMNRLNHTKVMLIVRYCLLQETSEMDSHKIVLGLRTLVQELVQADGNNNETKHRGGEEQTPKLELTKP